MLGPEDQFKFRILWRNNQEYPLREYFTKALKYGLDYAPWRMIRALHQVANDNPLDAETNWVIKNAFCMDDLVPSA